MVNSLVLGWAVIYANRTCLYPLLAVIASQLDLNSAQAGLVTSIYFIFYVIMQIPAGIAGDRFGLKNVLLVMFLISAFGLLGLGLFGTSYLLLLVFTGLHGLGAGAYYPAAFGTILKTVEPARRGFSSAILGIGMALGLLTGLAVSGPIYELTGSYRTPFVILSIPTFAVIMYIFLKVPNIKGGDRIPWADYKKVLLDKELIMINIATFMALYGFWVAISWGPSFLKLERGFSLGQAGFYTGLTALLAIPAAPVWGKLSDRFGRKLVALLVLPLASVTLFLISYVRIPGMIIVLLLIFGMFSNSAFSPLMVSWTGDIVNKRYPGSLGAAVGVFNGIGMCSAIVAPVISGYLRDLTGSFTPAMLAGSIIMMAGTLLILLVPQRDKTMTIAS